MTPDPLLTRDQFKTAVLSRFKGRCAFCDQPAVDAHHILERKLFPDQGYYLSNGAPVCEAHHWNCETTAISVKEVWATCGIETPQLPPGLNPEQDWDKWGNRIWPSGLRSWGPLEHDTGARKALAAGGYLGVMMPSTYLESE